MEIEILSLFPEYFSGPFDVSLIKKAREKGLLQIHLRNIREFGEGKHRKVDDRPFGGGPGMVLLPGPVTQAIRNVRRENSKVVYLSPQGDKLSSKLCKELAQLDHLVLLCGHYEGLDERVIELEVDQEISIGDYILMSGCPAALVLVEAVTRFLPGVLGNEASTLEESFEGEVFEAPHYTGPIEFETLKVPEVLRSGDHKKIETWRKTQALRKTDRVRPDLRERIPL